MLYQALISSKKLKILKYLIETIHLQIIYDILSCDNFKLIHKIIEHYYFLEKYDLFDKEDEILFIDKLQILINLNHQELNF